MSDFRGRLSDGDHAERAVITRLLTLRRLAWCHGDERAAQIMAGKDAETRADLAKWRALGVDDGRRKTRQASHR